MPTSWLCAATFSAISAGIGTYAEGSGTLLLVPVTNGQSGALSRITCKPHSIHVFRERMPQVPYLPGVIARFPGREKLVRTEMCTPAVIGKHRDTSLGFNPHCLFACQGHPPRDKNKIQLSQVLQVAGECVANLQKSEAFATHISARSKRQVLLARLQQSRRPAQGIIKFETGRVQIMISVHNR